MGQGGACKETDTSKGSCGMDILQTAELAQKARLQTGVQGENWAAEGPGQQADVCLAPRP